MTCKVILKALCSNAFKITKLVASERKIKVSAPSRGANLYFRVTKPKTGPLVLHESRGLDNSEGWFWPIIKGDRLNRLDRLI